MSRLSLAAFVLATSFLAVGLAPAASAQGAVEEAWPELWGQPLPNDPGSKFGMCWHPPDPPDLILTALDFWCITWTTAYEFIWFYPPGVFQVYCFVKAQVGEECPTPDPSGGVFAVGEFS